MAAKKTEQEILEEKVNKHMNAIDSATELDNFTDISGNATKAISEYIKNSKDGGKKVEESKIEDTLASKAKTYLSAYGYQTNNPNDQNFYDHLIRTNLRPEEMEELKKAVRVGDLVSQAVYFQKAMEGMNRVGKLSRAKSAFQSSDDEKEVIGVYKGLAKKIAGEKGDYLKIIQETDRAINELYNQKARTDQYRKH